MRSTSDEHEQAVTAWSVKRQALPFVRELGSTLELEADLRRFGKLQHLILELV